MRSILAAVLSLLVMSPLHARTIDVYENNDQPSGYSLASLSIQEAIDMAYPGDVIVIHPGTYASAANRNLELRGKALTVRSLDPDDPNIVAATIIDCNQIRLGYSGGRGGIGGGYYSTLPRGRGFVLRNGETRSSVISGLTIINGWGGVYCGNDSSPTISNCVFRGHSSNRGACVYTEGGAPRVVNCTFESNRAESGGGAIALVNEPPINGPILAGETTEIVGCTFLNNEVHYVERPPSDGGASSGGGGGRRDRLVLASDQPESTDAGLGGAVYSEHARIELIDCTFQGNIADLGGGIYLAGPLETGKVINCRLVRNRAVQGGGLFLGGGYAENYGSLQLINGVVTCNRATGDGGGLYLDGSVDLVNCTIVANHADGQCGGVFAAASDCVTWRIAPKKGNACPALYQSILWANTSFEAGDVLSAQMAAEQLTDVTRCCIQDDEPDDATIPFSNFPWPTNNIDDDPRFVALPDDGDDGWGDDPCTPQDESLNDYLGDLHLRPDSPCVDAGESSPYAVDIDNEPRVLGSAIDLGADEYSPPILVVTSPVAGEVWAAGSQHTIAWKTVGMRGSLDIELSLDAGQSWLALETHAPDTGIYTWTVDPGIDSQECLVRVVPSVPDPLAQITAGGPFTIHPDQTGTPVSTKWKTLAGNFQHTGQSQHLGPETGCVAWTFQTAGAISSSVTVGREDRIHIPCVDGKLYTLDRAGSLVWTYDAGAPLITTATVGSDGSLYVGSENGRLHVLDPNGRVRWTFLSDQPIYASPAVATNGKVFVGLLDGSVRALGENGSELWEVKLHEALFQWLASLPPVESLQAALRTDPYQDAVFGSPTIGPDGTVYVGALHTPNLYALDPRDGSILWTCNLASGPPSPSENWWDPWDPWSPPTTRVSNGWPFASPVLGDDGVIYQTALYDSYLYAVQARFGTNLWAVDLSPPEQWWCEPNACNPSPCGPSPRVGESWSEPVVASDGTVYASLDAPFLYAIQRDGSIKWSARLGDSPGFTLTVDTQGKVYAAGYDGHLHVIDPNGSRLSEFVADGPLSFPVVAWDDLLLVNGEEEGKSLDLSRGTLWAIELAGATCAVPDLGPVPPDESDPNDTGDDQPCEPTPKPGR